VARALADTKQLVDVLDERFWVPRAVLVPFVSGGKGMHLGIPTALWAPRASPDFHAVARQFAEAVATAAGGAVDAGVFDRVRAFRAPNSRHPKTGLHKRFVPVEILDTVTVNGVLSLARSPEAFDVPSTNGVERSDMLVAVWERAGRAVVEKAAAAAQRRLEVASGDRAVTLNRKTRAFLNGEVEVGERHPRLYSAAANLAELGCPLPAVRALLTEPALDLGLPPKDVERAIDNGFARAHSLVAHTAEVFGGTVTHVEYAKPEGGATLRTYGFAKHLLRRATGVSWKLDNWLKPMPADTAFSRKGGFTNTGKCSTTPATPTVLPGLGCSRGAWRFWLVVSPNTETVRTCTLLGQSSTSSTPAGVVSHDATLDDNTGEVHHR